MSNHVSNFLSGLGIAEGKNAAIRLLGDQKLCGKYTGYDFMFHENSGTLEFSSRNSSPVPAVAELSKHGPVELVCSSEADAYQIEKALKFEDGAITGHRERFMVDNKPEPWGDWQPVSKADSDKAISQFGNAIAA